MRCLRYIGVMLVLISLGLSEVRAMTEVRRVSDVRAKSEVRAFPIDSVAYEKKIRNWEKAIERNRYFKQLPAIADSIFHATCSLGQYQRAADAWLDRLNYYRQIALPATRKNFEKLVEETKSFCDAHHLVASSRRCRYLLVDYYARHEFYQEAIMENNRLLADAPISFRDEALLSWNQRMGNIYYTQRRMSLARKSYMKAGDLSMQQKLYRRAYSCYHMVGNCSILEGDYASALHATELTYKSVRMDKSLNAVNDSVLRVLEWVDRGVCYYHLNRKTEFRSVIDSLEHYPFLSLDKPALNYYLQVRSLGYLDKGDIKKAELYCDSIQYYEVRSDTYKSLYTHTGNYEKLATYLNQFSELPQKRLQKLRAVVPLLKSNLVLMSEIQMERTRLDQRNQRLLLQTHLAEELQQKNRAELLYLQQEYKLDESNIEARKVARQHEIGQVKKSMLQNEADTVRALLKKRTQNRYVVMFTFSFLTLGLLLFVYFRRNYIKRLHREELETERARKEAEKHMNEATEHLKVALENDEIKTHFIESISHEVRIPLNAIVGFSSLLTDDNAALTIEEKQEYAHQVEKNSVMLSTLVNGILDLANLTTGKYKMAYVPIAVYDLMNSLKVHADTHKKDGVEVLMNLAGLSETLMVETDYQRMLQASKALVDNACAFTDKGAIVLAAHVVPIDGADWLRISVSDTGAGIPEGMEEVIFQRFKKLDEFSEGCGLGLTVARTIIEIMGGRCYVDTSYKDGSRFCIDVPLVR